MSDTSVFMNSIIAGAVAIGAAVFLYTQSTSSTGSAEDGPGPNLEITVSGEASGRIVIDLDQDHAPKHVAQIVRLAQQGAFDNVVFHRVIDGFMAQTGDVQFGKAGGDLSLAGTGGSELPNIPAEFSDVPFLRGTVGMARANDPDSANSQFFIMFAPGDFLNGKYTVIGHVIEGMEVVDRIKRGDPDLNGAIADGKPDVMTRVVVRD